MSKLSEEYKNEIQEIFGEIYSKYMSRELGNIKNTLDTELSKKVIKFKEELINKIDSVTNYDEKLKTLIREFNEQKEKIGTLARSEELKTLINEFSEQKEKIGTLVTSEELKTLINEFSEQKEKIVTFTTNVSVSEISINNNLKFMKMFLWILVVINIFILILLFMKL